MKNNLTSYNCHCCDTGRYISIQETLSNPHQKSNNLTLKEKIRLSWFPGKSSYFTPAPEDLVDAYICNNPVC